MTRFGWIVVGGCLLAAAAIALLIWGFSRQAPSYEPATVALDTEVDPTTLSLYGSGTYGITFIYPDAATLTDQFASTSPAPAWRENASTDGDRIVNITLGAYQAHVGMSEDEDAVNECLDAAPGETAQGMRTVGENEWSVFTADEIGTENERRITSYRIVHDDACFALETIAPLSTDPTAAQQAANIDLVVQNFTFTR